MGWQHRADLHSRQLRKMANFTFQLDDHPARQKVRGVLVPVIKDVKAIRVRDEDDGLFYLCGYLNLSSGNVQLLQAFPDVFTSELQDFVAAELGQTPEVSSVNHLSEEPKDDGDSE